MTDDLDRALTHYQATLRRLDRDVAENVDEPDPSCLEKRKKRILAVLFARDRLQVLLNDSEDRSPAWFQQLYQADRRLEDFTQQIIGVIELETWQKTRSVSDDAWWWRLEQTTGWEKSEWLFNFGSLAGLTVALGLALDTSAKLLSGGFGTLGALSAASQGVLAIFSAKGALTNAGKAGLEQIFDTFKWPKQYLAAARMGTSIAIAALLWLSRGILPDIAREQIAQADRHYEAGRFAQARSLYTQALSIDPDNFEAQYNLGLLYEAIDDIDSAIEQYQIVVQTKPDTETRFDTQIAWLNAANNLGRLYILQGESDQAVVLLTRGLELVVQVKRVQQTKHTDLSKLELVHYTLLKNRGWARLQQERYAEARNDLFNAIGREVVRPDADCLLATLYQATDDAQVSEQWQVCLASLNTVVNEEGELVTPEANLDRDRWLGLAQQALSASPENESVQD